MRRALNGRRMIVPMAEVLAPAQRDISAEYKSGFEGMVKTAILGRVPRESTV
jgi:hypothetical protein